MKFEDYQKAMSIQSELEILYEHKDEIERISRDVFFVSITSGPEKIFLDDKYYSKEGLVQAYKDSLQKEINRLEEEFSKL